MLNRKLWGVIYVDKRSVVANSTMIVSPHYLASTAGARILEKGGNAFDAAITVSSCLAVVYPHMTGLGGDSFWLTYSATEGQVRGYNGSGRSGYKANLSRYPGLTGIPHRGIDSIVTVPGMVDAWYEVHARYGRLPWEEVLSTAITYAENGFPMSLDQAQHTHIHHDMLSGFRETASIFVPPAQTVTSGKQFKQRDLARTLRHIAVGGRNVFYKGKIAANIVESLQSKGGILIKDDFADHEGNWVEPLKGSYRENEVYQLPPNSQGFTGIMVLQMLEHVDFSAIQHGSYEYYHYIIEALKLSFRDRNQYLTDPLFSEIPLKLLLSKSYARSLYELISMSNARSISTTPIGNDTAYAAVVDEDGNAVSFIQSLYYEFGSGVVAGDTGILMQNRGSYFSLNPKHVNALAPGKRTFHTLMPAMICRGGKPYILYGTQGGEGQPQTQTALITRMLDYGLDPQQAINEPRWVWGRTWGVVSEELRLESRIDSNVVDRLRQAGHMVKVVDAYDGVMGHAHAILIDDQGYLHGGVDPRCDGSAIGW